MTHDSKLFDSIGARAMEVVAHMPPATFTAHDFVSHAMGMNALSNAAELGVMLKYLTEHELIRKLNTPMDQPSRWIRCAQRG